MNVLITGANGYIGRALTDRLLALRRLPDGRPIDSLTLFDQRFDEPPSEDDARVIEGSISCAETRNRLAATAPDIVFHLASVASGRAQTDFELGLQVNLYGTLGLLDALRQQGNNPVFVFTSSIAVFGTHLPELVTDATPPAPELSYGAQKRALEILLADYTRRGFVQGRAVRLPGIVMRPPAPNGAWSIFSSTLIRSLATQQPCTLPVSPDATLWLMSLPCCIDNLLHAGVVRSHDPMTLTLPALRVSVADIVNVFDQRTDGQARSLVRYEPQPDIQAQFGSLPLLETPAALAAGFRHDGSLAELIDRATEPLHTTPSFPR